MKKIVIVAHVESHILNFHLPYIQYLSDLGNEVIVVTKGHTKIPFASQTIHLPFDRNPFSIANIRCLIQLKKYFNSTKIDMVHCHTPVGGAIARIANFLSRNKSKVIYTAHGFHFYQGASFTRWIIYYPVELLLARITDELIVMNDEDYRMAKKFRLRRNGEIHLVHGVGINTKMIHDTPNTLNMELRKNLNISSDDKILLNIGELIPRKNQKILIDYMKDPKLQNYHLLICGEGELKETLEEQIHKLDLDNRVHLLGFRKDIISVIKASDIFVFPSIHEGLSIALIQAICCGLPAVASNIRGNSDILKQNPILGSLIDFCSEKAFVEAIFAQSLNENSKKRRSEMMNIYDIQSVLTEYLLIYKKIGVVE